MVCKNGLVHYILTGLFSGLVTGVICSLVEHYTLTHSVLLGALAGIAIPAVLWGCEAYDRHCAKGLRAEVKRTKNVICEGWAQVDETDGWLFLTDEGLEFYPYSGGSGYFMLPLSEASGCEVHFSVLKIPASEEDLELHVRNVATWARLIKDMAGTGGETK